jgi:hypothetical protein
MFGTTSKQVMLRRVSMGWFPVGDLDDFLKADSVRLDDGTMVKPPRKPTRLQLTLAEWHEEARRRFGEVGREWAFVCPSCGHVARVCDWETVGAKEGEVAYSCVGRHLANPKTLGQRPGPCNYAGGGLFGLNPVDITDDEGRVHSLFAFAPGRVDEPCGST